MRALLVCPAERPPVSDLARLAPLALLPVCGLRLIEHWLEHLADRGFSAVRVLAADRPEQLRVRVGDGRQWGLEVTVMAESRELTELEAEEKHAEWLGQDSPPNVFVMDTLPGLPHMPLFESYAAMFAAVQTWMPQAATPARIGVHMVQPGVWAGLHCRISPQARLRAPCWLGDYAWVRSGAVVGPHAVVEEHACVECGAEVSHSIVGPDTWVGPSIELRDSLAWGRTLVNWKVGSGIQVTDEFLLCGLEEPSRDSRGSGLLGRLMALVLLALTWPAALLSVIWARLAGRPGLRRREAVRPAPARGGSLTYYELPTRHPFWRRWPQLWNVVCGEFAWFGNRPLRPGQASQLKNDFERLWLEAPIGLLSLADVERATRPFRVEARAHASYYAVQASRWLDWQILLRALRPPVVPAVRDLGSRRLVSKAFELALGSGGGARPRGRRAWGRRGREFSMARSAPWPRHATE